MDPVTIKFLFTIITFNYCYCTTSPTPVVFSDDVPSESFQHTFPVAPYIHQSICSYQNYSQLRLQFIELIDDFHLKNICAFYNCALYEYLDKVYCGLNISIGSFNTGPTSPICSYIKFARNDSAPSDTGSDPTCWPQSVHVPNVSLELLVYNLVPSSYRNVTIYVSNLPAQPRKYLVNLSMLSEVPGRQVDATRAFNTSRDCVLITTNPVALDIDDEYDGKCHLIE